MKRTERTRRGNRAQNRLVHQRTSIDRGEKKRLNLPVLGVVLLIIGLIYLIFFSRVLDFGEVRVSGYNNPNIIQEIVSQHTQKGIFERNIILLNRDSIIESIKEDKSVRKVDFSVKYPNILYISVEQSIPAIIWSSGGEYFEIDDRGQVVRINQSIEGLPVVYDYFNIPIAAGEIVASPSLIKYIIDLSENFTSITGSEIGKIFIHNLLSDIRVKSSHSWSAYLNSQKDPVSQLEILTKVIEEAKRDGATSLEYIDMRLDDKIFYK